MRSYVFLSWQPQVLCRKGFEESERPANESYELMDGTKCYVTDLWPIGASAELSLPGHTVRFRTSSKISAQFYVGAGARAAHFDRIGPGRIKLDDLPLLCLVIPAGYFTDVQQTLTATFRVFADDRPAAGKWEPLSGCATEDKDFYIWKWGRQPFMEKVQSGAFKDFRQLRQCYRSPDFKGGADLFYSITRFPRQI